MYATITHHEPQLPTYAVGATAAELVGMSEWIVANQSRKCKRLSFSSGSGEHTMLRANKTKTEPRTDQQAP